LEHASWHWLFWINVPVGILALIAARGLIPPGATHQERPLDRTGLFLISAGLPLLLYGATEIGAAGPSLLYTVAVIAGAVLSGCFIATSVRTPSPLVDLRLMRSNTFAAATVTTGLTGANMYGGL